MKRLVIIFGLLLSLVLLVGCSSNGSYSESQVYKIVEDCLTKGEIANLLYWGEFTISTENALIASNGLVYDPVEQGTEFSLLTSGNVWDLIQSFSSAEDIKAYMQSTFVPTLAQKYLAGMFTDKGDKYIIQDGQLLQCRTLPVYPLSLIQWQHQPLEIVTNQSDKLVVMLSGEFILTGTKAELPLTLTQQNGQWLLDESFSPREHQAEDYFYTETELQGIVENVLERIDKVKQAYPIHDDSSRKLFQEAFIYEAAEYYYLDFTNRRWGQLRQNQWEPTNYQIWLNERDRLVLIVQKNDGTCRPLNFYLVGEQWLTDESYAAQVEFVAVPAILPFSIDDLRLPFDWKITPEQFVQQYGKPISTEISLSIGDSECLTYNYANFSITWLNWGNKGYYSIYNIESQTGELWPELRGICLGDSRESVIKRFHHCQPYDVIDPVYGLPMLYGVYEHLADYGLIDGDDLVYVAGDKVIRLTFVDDKLTSWEFQAVDS